MRIVLGLEGRRSQWDLGIDYSYCLYMQNNSRPLSDMQLFYPWRPGPVALTSSSLPTSLSFSCLGWIQAYERFSSENSFWVTWKQGSCQQATARVCEPAHLRRLVPCGFLRPRPRPEWHGHSTTPTVLSDMLEAGLMLALSTYVGWEATASELAGRGAWNAIRKCAGSGAKGPGFPGTPVYQAMAWPAWKFHIPGRYTYRKNTYTLPILSMTTVLLLEIICFRLKAS